MSHLRFFVVSLFRLQPSLVVGHTVQPAQPALLGCNTNNSFWHPIINKETCLELHPFDLIGL